MTDTLNRKQPELLTIKPGASEQEIKANLISYLKRQGIEVKMNKKILYIDMDNVLVDFQSGIDQQSAETIAEFEGRPDEIPGIFGIMRPLEGAIDSFLALSSVFDTYILSSARWGNPSAWSDKNEWVKKYLGEPAIKRLILSHHKNLNRGDYLIDDRTANGAGEFTGEHLHFGHEGGQFPDWDSVRRYLLP